MKKVVWEYRINNGCVVMPKGAQVLCVTMEENYHIILHALVDPQQRDIQRDFIVIGTDQAIEMLSPEKFYVGTIYGESGKTGRRQAMHVFEVIRIPTRARVIQVPLNILSCH